MSLRKLASAGLAAAALASLAPSAHAGGLYFSDRGVRPLGRAGAFVAGADDLGAISYNPAGILDAGSQLLIDASWLHFTSDYTRQMLVYQSDPNTGEITGSSVRTFPTVQGAAPVLPIPTLALSFQPDPKVVLALGLWAPYAAITTYPDVLEGKPAPQRYSLITLDGSALAILGGYAAFAPTEDLRLGAGVEMLTGNFVSSLAFSGCVPDRFFCAPEQSEWDVAAEMEVGPIFAPSGRVGAIWRFLPDFRAGAAFSLPFWVRAPATIRTRLPATPVFERASQEGDEADVAFDLPWTLKAGIEGRAVENLRVELGFGLEHWSMHDSIDVEPNGIALKNIAGFPKTYYIPPVSLPRNFEDAISVRLGGEYAFELGGYGLEVRTGVSYETSAVPPAYLSVLTLDSPKVTAALGGSLHIGKFRFDAVYAHLFATDVDVAPKDARIPQVSPVRANAAETPYYINGGQYSLRADVLGVGLTYQIDPPEPFPQDPSEPAAEGGNEKNKERP